MALDPYYEVVIGLEVHAQMLTRSKLFCRCSTRFGAGANRQICPVCAAFPGVLPVLNQEAVNMAIKTGLAIKGRINRLSEFSRKNYFYPDLPAGYQISQYELPLVEHGELWIDDSDGQRKRVGITRIHMEVDAGKSLHEGVAGGSWVDLNRTGIPLMEVVSEPDLRSSAEAGDYLKKLRVLVRYLGVCDGNMEEGSFRCDANVSVRRRGHDAFGTRCELKNLNSIRHVMRAIDYEAERQIDLLESGQRVRQETRLWDVGQGVTRPMRGKEEAHDYRYFPEPDLPPLRLDEARIESLRQQLPELPDARRQRFIADYGLSDYDAAVLTAGRELADYYEQVVEQVAQQLADNAPTMAKIAANWMMGDLLTWFNDDPDKTRALLPAAHLAQLIDMIQRNTISGKIAKDVLARMYASASPPEPPSAIVERLGLQQVSDEGALEAAIQAVLQSAPDELARYRAGQTRLLPFFVGQVMKATRGKANPARVNELLQRYLSATET
ncbi:MAG: Asp-tRNA(Asn)/Glu-tRNA(Gln) amidotransferase subunit GatB [Magnetococcales bacterium]|nr:Asp-tRNA(Asn)/Glu-tRNA(Gln) amidotransferase subunit GatB [Magnetococcales bacterium]